MSSAVPLSDYDAPRMTRAVRTLLALNVAVFFIQKTVVSPADMQSWLGFEMSDFGQWWTVATYMFVHAGFWHLLLNMYTLAIFGPRVEAEWGAGAFTRFYLWCGLGGWLFHLVFDRSGLLVGASAAVLGVMLAFALRWPREEIYLFGVVPMQVRWYVAFLAGINAMQTALGATGVSQTSTAVAAHVGGFAFAWLYLRSPSAGSIERLRQRVSTAPDISDEAPRPVPRALPRQRERVTETDDVVAKSKAAAAQRPPRSGAPRRAAVVQSTNTGGDEINTILDKISAQGMDSLTVLERRVLEDAAERMKGHLDR